MYSYRIVPATEVVTLPEKKLCVDCVNNAIRLKVWACTRFGVRSLWSKSWANQSSERTDAVSFMRFHCRPILWKSKIVNIHSNLDKHCWRHWVIIAFWWRKRCVHHCDMNKRWKAIVFVNTCGTFTAEFKQFDWFNGFLVWMWLMSQLNVSTLCSSGVESHCLDFPLQI